MNQRDKLIEQILTDFSEVFKVTQQELTSRDRTRRVSNVRQLYCYICYYYTPSYMIAIGKLLGNRHHTTVGYAVTCVTNYLKINDATFDVLLIKYMTTSKIFTTLKRTRFKRLYYQIKKNKCNTF